MTTKKLNTIFIVEDNEVERSMLKDHLSKYSNITVKEYSTGVSCINDLIVGKIEEPDLILMDYFLNSSFGPSNDGLDALTRIKEISPETEVVMFTSVDNVKIMDLARKKGALDYVVKGTTGYNDLDAILEKNFTVDIKVQN